jgi:hypothetical protein
MIRTALKAIFGLAFIMVVLGYALHAAHEHENLLMCERYGGKSAVYKSGICMMPMDIQKQE